MLAVTIAEFSVPSRPGNITSGPDGNLWYTASGAIGRITASGVATEFQLYPPPNHIPVNQITAGPDGNVWFTDSEANMIGRITPAGVISEFPVPTTHGDIADITAGPDGNLWFVEFIKGVVGRITPAGVVTEFGVAGIGVPISIVSGPDGNLWINSSLTGDIARITPTGNFVSKISLGVTITGEFTFDANGDLWAPVLASGLTIARMTAAGVLTEFPLNQTNGIISNLTRGPDGNMWFLHAGFVGRITPAGTITEFPTPTGEADYQEITTGPDGNLWYTKSFPKKIGRVHIEELTPNQRFVAQVYRDLLQREADPGGLAAFSNLLDQGLTSRSQVVLAIENSQEYRTDVVVDVYGQFLGRNPDPSGLSGWVSFLGQGGTRQKLEALILGSQEYLLRRGGETNTGFLQAVYHDVLGRTADPTGLAFWSQILTKGESGENEEDEPASQARRREIAASILQSPESMQDRVQTWYGLFLHRAADPIGLNALSLALQQGLTDERAIAVLIGSEEYFARL